MPTPTGLTYRNANLFEDDGFEFDEWYVLWID